MTMTSVLPFTDCSDGAVRLVGGTGEEGKMATEGTVEVCQGQQWVAVCDRSWSQREAMVTCRQLRLTAGERGVKMLFAALAWSVPLPHHNSPYLWPKCCLGGEKCLGRKEVSGEE